MKKCTPFIAGALCLFTMMTFTACLTNGSGSGGFERPSTGGGERAFAAPSSFLRSGFGPLSEWLDGRYDVTYRNMRLGGSERENIFSQQPIEEVHYRFEDVGRSGTLFQLKANNISRREILYRIAQTYGLQMTIEDVNGKPAFIQVKGNDRGSRFNPGQTLPDETKVREL
jgi:hypothetical protein